MRVNGSKWRLLTAGVAVASAMALAGNDFQVDGAQLPKGIELVELGAYATGYFDQGGAEIAAYDAASKRLFVVNLRDRSVDLVDISNPGAPFLAHKIDVSPWGSQANSVSVRDGVAAIAIEAPVKTSPGTVAFFTGWGQFLSAVPVGALPDMLTHTPNGQMVLVANEGEPSGYGPGFIDPPGSVSIIDLRGGVESLTAADVTAVGFEAFNAEPLDPRIRIFGPGATVAQDLEPEYIAVSHDSQTAWVTLQENNALGIIDLKSRRVTRLVGLGFKNHNLFGAGLDPSDRDTQSINISPRRVWGMYQPDAIDTYEYRGRTYLVTANEGDVREWPNVGGPGVNNEAARVSTLALDATAFPDGAALKANASLGRLQVTTRLGNIDGDSDFDRLYSFGARSFSIWDDRGELVYDSGDAFERTTSQRLPDWFNANHTNNVNLGNPNDWTRDSRSDDKGPEPEGVTIARVFGRQYAFIALERIGGVMVYELGDPRAPRFVDYVNVRTFGVDGASAAAKDLGPEGIIVIKEEDSPSGRPLLVTANEVSGTTRVFEIRPKK